MAKNPAFILSAALLFSITINAGATGDITAGKQKAQLCAACHGADGNSSNPMWPSLAGQHAEYIEKQVHDFKNGARENAQMAPMVAPLNDQDIEDIAAYFASQKLAAAQASPEGLEHGEQLYRAGNAETGVAACMACHGPAGNGNPAAKYPSLAGQHADYTAAQLQAFKTGNRSNDMNNAMGSVAGKMTDEEIQAVANYIQGLH